MKKYDVIIIGAGPAGIFAALELVKKDKVSVLLLEKGKDLSERNRRIAKDITTGWGGAGAFSDGKLNLSTEVGGWLTEYVSPPELEDLIGYADDVYREFGGDAPVYGVDEQTVADIRKRAAEAGLELIPTRIRHLGTEICVKVLKAMRDFLDREVEIRTGMAVEQILIKDGRVVGVVTGDGEETRSDYVVVAPGREGADWLAAEGRRLKLQLVNNAVDIGMRVETPAVTMEPLTLALYESKLIYRSRSFQDRVRTFCMNPYGEVTTERFGDVITVNGHSYAGKKTDKTNFALLASTSFTEPFKEPIAYGKYIARLANLLGEGILIQRLGDLHLGRRSTRERIAQNSVQPTLKDATPGDLSFVLPYRYISDILEMLEALDTLVPGVNSSSTLLYGVEVKFYSSRLRLKPTLETEVKNLYAAGDGAGVTRGLIQASVSGVVAGRSILGK